MIEVWIKTCLGRGPEYMFKVNALPRVGDEIILSEEGSVKEVKRVIHYVYRDQIIIFTT